MAKPVVLCILDGWGLSETSVGNAPVLANTPNFDRLMATCPNATLITHGPDVGLPKGQMGNSEVGHTNIGAGRVVAMDLGQIDLAIEDGSFGRESALLEFAGKVKAAGGTAHLMAVLSDGGVHAHINHLIAAVNALTVLGVKVAIHAITDGRDVAQVSAEKYLAEFRMAMPNAMIATLTGRYFALDRDNRWERVSTAFNAMIHGQGAKADSAEGAIAAGYAADKTDEFMPATVIGDYAGVVNGDGIFCLNFRADRAREILAAIGQADFDAFDVGNRPDLSALLGMVSYSDAHDSYMTTMYPKRDIQNTLGAWVAKAGKRQFHLAETEKYPHVTFFLNGGREAAEKGEDRYMPASPKVATYDLQPEMSAGEVTEHLVRAILDGYDLIVVNFANPDMVGHTGDLNAAMKACEAVDQGLGHAIDALVQMDGSMIVTADHGNCEMMIDPVTGNPHTAHTTNPVPVIMVGGPDGATLANGRLADLAPTILALMDMDQPAEMTGMNLIR